MAYLDPTIKRGSAELAILSVLAREPLHGYEIARRIEHKTGGVLRFTLASLYPMLYRLEKRGWLKATWESGRGGPPRRCYRLTADGRKKLDPVRRQWRVFFMALDGLARFSRA